MSRFIPAGAGNTDPTVSAASSSSVYPRWRGEHIHGKLTRILDRGLSPLARGTPNQPNGKQGKNRFIPAGAGNTTRNASAPAILSVYPRWRGEHHRIQKLGRAESGLSPLARGTHNVVYAVYAHPRFIPAGAGNTRSASLPYRCTSGLSPLARGTLRQI